MPRTPHSRTQPPAPKERPVALAGSAAPRGPAPSPFVPPLPPPPASETGRRSDMVGFWTFALLIALGLIAAARAFLTM